MATERGYSGAFASPRLIRDNMKEAANEGSLFRQLMATWWDAA